jgi:hypothetical protein
VLPDINCHEAVSVLDRIRDSLAHSHSGAHPAFTVSFGVTDTSCAGSIEQLLQLADDGLYRSKQDGRDRVTVAEHISQNGTAAGAQVSGSARTNGKGGASGQPNGDEAQNGAPVNGGTAANGNVSGPRGRMKVPALHRAADERDPRPTGREIR